MPFFKIKKVKWEAQKRKYKGRRISDKKIALTREANLKGNTKLSLSADSQLFSSLQFDFIICMPQFCTVHKYKINILKVKWLKLKLGCFSWGVGHSQHSQK